MTTDSRAQTAKIYQFPLRTAARGAVEQVKPVADAVVRAPETAFGGGWYHEAAIQEAELVVKR
jgi:Protein of unknown function (DUF2735)